MDRVAREGIVGRSRNVPDRFLPASDVATLSLFGYDPERYYTGRAPLEAAAMGIELGPDDWAIRCNLMTIQRRPADRLHRRPHHQRRGPGPDRVAPGGAGPSGDRVPPRSQLPQRDDLPRPAGRSAVHRRDRDRSAPRPPRSAGRRASAPRAGIGPAPGPDERAGAVLEDHSREPGPDRSRASRRRMRSGSGDRARRRASRGSPMLHRP